MDTWEKSELLATYSDNLRIQAELDQALQEKKGEKEGLDAFHERSDRLVQLFRQNEAIAASLRETAQEEKLTPEAAQFLCERLLKRSSQRHQGGRVAMPILSMLIPYYEEHHDPEKLARLYGYVYNALAPSSARMERDDVLSKTVYSRKIIELRSEYENLRDVRSRLEIFMAYYNICVAERSEGLVSVDESYDYLREMLELWNSETVQRLDGENEHILWYVTLTQQEWLSVENEIDNAQEPAIAYFCQLAGDCFEEEQETIEEPYECSNAVCAAYYHARVLQGDQSWDEALEHYFDYYVQRMDHPEESEDGGMTMEEASFLLETPLTLERWLHECTDEALKERILNKLKEDTHTILIRRFAGLPETTIAKGLARWCFTMLPYLQDREEKEEWMFNLVLRKQFLTYLHSVMVARLCDTIARSLLGSRPQLFEPVKALLGEQDLLEYVTKAALFHDIGKSEIAEIVNTQVRSLEQDEFAQIRKHPGYGYALIGGDADLKRYGDVMLGHHRFYSGQGGYPEDFDNTNSPYRFIINLVAICDSLDAATDSLGRNYKGAKSFDQVLAELEEGKGTRYDPDIVDHLAATPALQARLRTLVGEERGNAAYEIYTMAIQS